MTDNDILFTQLGHIGQVMLNRPQALNAITPAMAGQLSAQLTKWQHDTSILAVVIRGNGPRGFCAGGDLLALKELADINLAEAHSLAWIEYRLINQIANYPKPYIALCHSITMGGGVGIAVHGSHRVGSPDLVLAMPETRIGFVPDVGASYFLSRTPGQFGKLMALAALHVNASDCLALGLVDHIIDSVMFDAVVDSLASTPAEDMTQQLAQFHQIPPASKLTAKSLLVDDCFQHPNVESILDALETTQDAWAKDIHQRILANAPTSLKVALAAQHRGATLSLAQCLEMEYHIALHCSQQGNLSEGIRARIIDKDNQPNWQPDTLTAVDQAMVNQFFRPVAGHCLKL